MYVYVSIAILYDILNDISISMKCFSLEMFDEYLCCNTIVDSMIQINKYFCSWQLANLVEIIHIYIYRYRY